MIIQIAAVGIISVIAVLLVRSEKPDIAVAIAIIGGVTIVLSVLDYFLEITAFIAELAEKTGVGGKLVGYLLKIVGAGYIIEFACDAAEEAKLTSLSSKIALGGKVVILCLILPIVKELVNVVISLSEYF